MSLVITRDRRLWPLVISAVIAVVAVAATGALVSVRGSQVTVEESSEATLALAAPGRDQATWNIRVVPRKGAQTESLTGLVTSVYDAVFLHPDTIDAALEEHFTSAAARAWTAADVGWPPRTHRVRILRRSANVTVQSVGGQRAAAIVKLVGGATVGGRRVKLWHRSTLWLEKQGAGWRVVAFELDQKPKR